MGFVSTASAQSKTSAIASGDASFLAVHSSSVMAAVGILVVLVSLFLVLKNRPVTTGQSVILGVGLVFLAMPFITNFEWSGDGFKVTMQSATIDLTREVARLTEDNRKVREELLQLSGALKGAVAKVEEVTPPVAGEPAKTPSVSADIRQWNEVTQPKFFEEFSNRNQSAIESSQQGLGRIQGIERTLRLPKF
ncbi:hypothetical protein M0654_21930 [Rhizobium sp. NTR19]|uniref:Uncharacterized protein n=1 Tax=Neorhizobium turbinariae TaxID=2937795 RepID=A0ABT0IXL3_9HYPH|nr:hypothetical protein [Neorhizobium turbinariae]MCK8782632.1 hypothetical protein [Neorhizobium turbinariae]